MSTHLEKFKKHFLKYRKYGISLNQKNYAFMVCFGTILGFIVSKKRNTFDPNKIEVLVKIPMPKAPQEIQVFNGMVQFYI